MNIFIILREEM